MIPRLLQVCLVCSVFAVSLNAQKGGGAPPAPSGQPNVPTRNPTLGGDPAPNPANPPARSLTLRGRIITDGSELPVTQLEVRIETEGGQPVGFGYADSRGQFTVQTGELSTDQTVFI